MKTIRMVLYLFANGREWKLAGLLGLIVTMAFVQTVGVASILPFMNLVAQPSAIRESALLSRMYETLGFQNDRSFLIFVGAVVLAITAASNAFSALTNWIILRFVWNRNYELSVRLLRKYINAPYSFFFHRNSADLAKNILDEVREAITGYLLPMMHAVAQGLVALAIIALLIWVDYRLALVAVLTLGASYGGLYMFIRRRQLARGAQRVGFNQARYRAANEAFGSMKEVKVLGREEALVKRFSVPAYRFAIATAKGQILSQIPRYVLETVAFGGIIGIVLYVLGTQDDFGRAIAVMSLYAVAGYRLMPALKQIFAGLTVGDFYSASLKNLYAELIDADPTPSSKRVSAGERAAPTYERDITLDRVSFAYENSDEKALRDVTLRIEKNTAVGLAGSTGSGKTTLLDIFLGLLTPQEGAIRVDGTALTDDSFPGWRERIGYVPQQIYLLDDSLWRNIAFGLPEDQIDREAVKRAARIANVHDFILSLNEGYDTIVGERGIKLSGGQRQRVGIARALYDDPDILVLDEATSALDGITEDAVIEAIHGPDRNKTLLIVAHRLDTLKGCATIFLFERGQIAACGSYAELLETNHQFRTMAKHSPGAEA